MARKTSDKSDVPTLYELDQLKEVINIGCNHASTALAQMIGRQVFISAPEVYVEKVEDISKVVGKESTIYTAIVLRILGDAPGFIIYIFPHEGEEIHKLISLITKKRKSKDVSLTEYDISVLKEVGNILSGATLMALSKFLNISLIHSVSEATTDMLGAITNSMAAEISAKSDNSILFKVTFNVEKERVKPILYFILDPTISNKILQLLKKQMG
jgi:chemotaxis protein CheC